MSFRVVVMLLLSLCASFGAKASETMGTIGDGILDLTTSGYGFIAIAIFVIAYVLVILEEKLHLRKSKYGNQDAVSAHRNICFVSGRKIGYILEKQY